MYLLKVIYTVINFEWNILILILIDVIYLLRQAGRQAAVLFPAQALQRVRREAGTHSGHFAATSLDCLLQLTDRQTQRSHLPASKVR